MRTELDKEILSIQETIKSFQVDYKKELRIGVLFGFLQEAAYKHAEKLKVGISDLHRTNQFWVLSRVIIEIIRYPKWNENITINTWPKGLNKLFAMRDFEIFDEEENSIVKATTAWLVLDANTRRPVRVIEGLKEIKLHEHSAIEEMPEKISPFKSEVFKNYSADYSAIDLNGHVNNTKYIDWISDTLPKQKYDESKIKRLQINFNSEMYWNDELKLFYEEEKNKINYLGLNSKKEKNTFQAIIEF